MRCSVKLVIGEGDVCIGPGLVELLEQITNSSSVQEAAKRMDVSYSKAWKIIRQAEQSLDVQLVFRKSGGPNGGQAQVTEYGKRLIKAFRRTEKQVSDFAGKKVADNFQWSGGIFENE